MKKIFLISVIFATLFTACDDAVIETIEGNTIRFDNAFVTPTTRVADIDIENLQGFDVFAWMSNANGETRIFGSEDGNGNAAASLRGELVHKVNNSDWAYNGGARYWFAGAQYSFFAFASQAYTSQQGLYDLNYSASANNSDTTPREADPVSFIYRNNGADAVRNSSHASAKEDFVVAKAVRKTSPAGSVLTAEDILPVSLKFHHVLSKVAFKFINDFEVKDVTLRIENISLKGIANQGTFEFYSIEDANYYYAQNNSDVATSVLVDVTRPNYSYSFEHGLGSWYVEKAKEGELTGLEHSATNHNGAPIGIVFPRVDSTTPEKRTSSNIEITNFEIPTNGSENGENSQDGDVTVGEENGNVGSNKAISEGNYPPLKAQNYAVSECIYIIPEEIPNELYYLSFKVTMYQGSENPIQIGVFDHSIPVTAMTFEQNKQYLLTASLNSGNVNPSAEIKPITFSVSVQEWGEDIDAGNVGGFPEK